MSSADKISLEKNSEYELRNDLHFLHAIEQIFKSSPHFEELCSHEIQVAQIRPHERWVEQDPLEILEAVRVCAARAIEKLDSFIPRIYSIKDIISIGITNQRETIVVWDKHTGLPLHNAIGKLMNQYFVLKINSLSLSLHFFCL